MEKYYTLSIRNYNMIDNAPLIEHLAMTEYQSMGIEEFSIGEKKVDELLGERSYSGADLPESVIDEVSESISNQEDLNKIFYFNSYEDAKRFQDYLRKFHLDSTIAQNDARDWNEQWKKSYRPIPVSNELEIVPSWQKESYTSSFKHQVYIYPGMGFGTGSHETTFLCLKLMLKTNLMSKNLYCMDYGCGSGILGLALRKINPTSKIDLFDIDQAALENCKQNLDLNDLSSEGLRFLLPKDRGDFYKKYGLVFANILKNVLEAQALEIISLVDAKGSLIVSGLLNGQQEQIIKLYTKIDGDLHLKLELVKGDWVALLFEKDV